MYNLLLVYCFFLFLTYSKKTELPFLILIGIGLILFSGLRFESGLDYLSYKELYSNANFSSSEILYWAVSIAHKYIFNSYSLFILMTAIFVISIKLYMLKKLSNQSLWFSVFIFITISYSTSDMGLIRNSYSMAFFMLSFYYYYKNKNKLSYFYFLVAFLFHHATIFMLFIYFINKNSKVSYKYILLLLISISISSFNLIYELLYNIANSDYISSNLSYISWKMNFYLTNESYQANNFNFYTVRFFLISLLFYSFRKRIGHSFLIKIYIFGTFLIIIFSFNIQFYSRIGFSLILFEMILMSYFINIFRGWSRVIVIFTLLIFYIILFARISYIFNLYNISFL
jgi:hypothetical protein